MFVFAMSTAMAAFFSSTSSTSLFPPKDTLKPDSPPQGRKEEPFQTFKAERRELAHLEDRRARRQSRCDNAAEHERSDEKKQSRGHRRSLFISHAAAAWRKGGGGASLFWLQRELGRALRRREAGVVPSDAKEAARRRKKKQFLQKEAE